MYNKFCYVNTHAGETSFIKIEKSLDLQICLNLLSMNYKDGNYALIKVNKVLGHIKKYLEFEKIITPNYFFLELKPEELKPNFDSFSLVSEKFIKKMIKLWNAKEMNNWHNWFYGREGYALNLIKNNYKKYINEAKIRNIIK